MPPKTKKGKGSATGKKEKLAERPKAEPVTEESKEHYQLQIRDLEGRLERYQKKWDEIVARESQFQAQFEQLSSDKKEIVSFLKRTLNQRIDEIADLNDQLNGLQQAKDAEKKAYEAQLAQVRHEYQETKDRLTSENMLLAGKLASLEEFRVQKEELMAKFAALEDKLRAQEEEHKEMMYNLEKKAVLDKDRLKKEMVQRVNTVAAEFRRVSNNQMAETTKRAIRENVAISSQLTKMSDKSMELIDENDLLKERDAELRKQLEVLEENEKELAKKNLSNQKVIRMLTEKCQQQQEILDMAVQKEHTLHDLQMEHRTLQEEAQALRQRMMSLEEEIQRVMAEKNKIMEELESEKEKRQYVETALDQAALSLKEVLMYKKCCKILTSSFPTDLSFVLEQETPKEEKEDDAKEATFLKRQNQLLEKLLLLLNNAAMLGYGPGLTGFQHKDDLRLEHHMGPKANRYNQLDSQVTVMSYRKLGSSILKGPVIIPHNKLGDLGLVPRQDTSNAMLSKIGMLSRTTRLGSIQANPGGILCVESVTAMDEGGSDENSSSDTKDNGIFCTAVSEEQLQEARRKAQLNIFGSSKVFLALDGNPRTPKRPSYEDIVHQKMTEHYKRGLQCLSQENWEKAVILFSKAINLCPEKMELYTKRAEAFLQLGDFQSAALNLQKACSATNPPAGHIELLAVTYYLQGQTLFEQRCHMEALESFTCAAELQPQNKHYHMRSICCLAALGRYEECIRLMNKRLEEEQDNPDLYIVRARLYDHLNQVTLTLQDVQKALSLDPQHQEALKIRDKLKEKAADAKDKAVNYAVQAKLQESLQKISNATECNPLSAEYHIFRGTVYRRLENFSPAVEDFVRAMQLCSVENGPDFQNMKLHIEAENQLLITYNDFAVHCYTKGFYQDGVLLLNKALRGEKNKKELYINRGDCFLQLGDLPFALADYQQAFELDENDWGVRTRLAKLLNEMGVQAQHMRQYQQAERYFSEAIQKHPLLSQPYLHRARLRHQLNRNMDGQEDAVLSILLNPKSDEVTSTVMTFFPGKTLEKVLTSELANSARHLMERNLKHITIKCEDSAVSVLQSGSKTLLETKKNFALCISDQQLHEMVQSQRKLKSEIQTALNGRGSLRSTAPHISQLPPLEEEKPGTSARYHWRRFGLGINHQKSALF
ncbi:uncharacterized protein PAF06_000355 [Gastrophryne carolinensis]